jgi:hypothetical protein
MNTPLRTPPDHWRLNMKTPFFAAYDHRLIDVRVLVSRSTVKGGDQWFHVSVSRPDRLPTWTELNKVRDEFLGPDTEAYHVLARKSDHVNIHENCLHLWAPVDGERRVANLRDLINEEAP